LAKPDFGIHHALMANRVPFPPPVELTDEDVDITETACRSHAARCRREGAIDEAEHWERVADKIARGRTLRCSNRD
jgi:hypothetical protein